MMGNKSMGEQLQSVTTAIEKGKARDERLLYSAEEIMVAAVHLLRFRSDDNELAARTQEWLTEFAG